MKSILLGTRGSALALTQTRMVTEALQQAHPELEVDHEVIQTLGDQRQDLRFSEFQQGDQPLVDKGIFIKELEVALLDRRVHAAVHSLKDVPSELEASFAIAAVLPRASVEDVLITAQPSGLESLPEGARVGTSSVRRARQLKWLRPDLEMVEIRGNVPTRLKKVVGENPLDAVMLAAAGLERLGFMVAGNPNITVDDLNLHGEVLPQSIFLPAAGQGAVAIEVLAAEAEIAGVLQALNDSETAARVSAEREFLKILGAGCHTPVGAQTWIDDGELHMRVRVFDEEDESAEPVETEQVLSMDRPLELARKVAQAVNS